MYQTGLPTKLRETDGGPPSLLRSFGATARGVRFVGAGPVPYLTHLDDYVTVVASFIRCAAVETWQHFCAAPKLLCSWFGASGRVRPGRCRSRL